MFPVSGIKNDTKLVRVVMTAGADFRVLTMRAKIVFLVGRVRSAKVPAAPRAKA